MSKLCLREKDTMAYTTADMLDKLVEGLGSSSGLDDEGVEFRVFRLHLDDAICYLEQTASYLRKQDAQ